MDFQDRMAIGKQLAKEARDSGGSTVQVFATTSTMLARHGKVEYDNFDHWLCEVQSRVIDILESTRRTFMTAQDWEDMAL